MLTELSTFAERYLTNVASVRASTGKEQRQPDDVVLSADDRHLTAVRAQRINAPIGDRAWSATLDSVLSAPSNRGGRPCSIGVGAT